MKKPYVIVNCAMTADGKLALPSGKQLRISNDEDIKRMFHLRNDCDAVLVGYGTILSDNPKLTVKKKYVEDPKNPIRVILDTHCRTDPKSLAVNDKAKTLIMTTKNCDKKYSDNVEIIKCSIDHERFVSLNEVLEKLYDYGIRKLLVEGGSTVIWNFLKHRLVDDMFVFIGPVVVGGECTPTLADGNGIEKEEHKINLEIKSVKIIGNGLLVHYKLIK